MILRSLHRLAVRQKIVLKTAINACVSTASLDWTRSSSLLKVAPVEMSKVVYTVTSTGYYWPFQLLLIVQTLIGQRSFALPTVWNSLASALNDSNLFLQVCAAAKIIFSDSGDHHPAALWRIAILRLQMFRVSHFLSFFLSFL